MREREGGKREEQKKSNQPSSEVYWLRPHVTAIQRVRHQWEFIFHSPVGQKLSPTHSRQQKPPQKGDPLLRASGSGWYPTPLGAHPHRHRAGVAHLSASSVQHPSSLKSGWGFEGSASQTNGRAGGGVARQVGPWPCCYGHVGDSMQFFEDTQQYFK